MPVIRASRSFFLSICCFGLVACGVRGKPLPPLETPPIGRGEPTYQKYSEKIVDEKAEKDKEDEENSKEKKKSQ